MCISPLNGGQIGCGIWQRLPLGASARYLRRAHFAQRTPLLQNSLGASAEEKEDRQLAARLRRI